MTSTLRAHDGLRGARASAPASSRSPCASLPRTPSSPGRTAARSRAREAEAVILDRDAECSIEAVVALAPDEVVSWTRRTDIQPMAVITELMEAEELVLLDPEFQGSDGAPGHHRLRGDPGRRLAGRALRRGRGRRPAARAAASRSSSRTPATTSGPIPIDGVIAFVDLNRLEVLRVDDHGVVPIPPESGNFDVAAGAPLRDDIAPLEITQPDGPGFALDGPRAVVAALAGARRLHAARGPRAQPGRLRRRRAAALDPVPRLALRDGRALRRSRARATTGRTPSTPARTASASPRRRSRAAATAWARSSTSTRSSRTPRARSCRSRTRSASTRRTPACSGGTSSGATARARCAARDAS